MISQLILTTLMALGIATGSLGIKADNESGNVLNTSQENKTQTKRASEESYEVSLPLTRRAQYGEKHPTNENIYYYNEYSRWEINYGEHSPNPVILEDKMIYNSVYTLEYSTADDNTINRYNYYIGVFKIINIFNSTTNFQINSRYLISTNSTPLMHYATIRDYLSDDDDCEDLFNLTMNASVKDRILNTISQIDKLVIKQDDYSWNNNETDYTIANNTGNITLQASQSKYLITYVMTSHSSNGSQYGDDTSPQNIIVSSTYIQPQITTEIVDIPNLMYTIITMPFSFISQAFNLTIFPNTPYQINFNNLFMTFLAIFILFWIIKKVFH